jgi:hypothetical protein
MLGNDLKEAPVFDGNKMILRERVLPGHEVLAGVCFGNVLPYHIYNVKSYFRDF